MKKFNLYLAFSVAIIIIHLCLSFFDFGAYIWLADVVYIIAPVSAFLLGIILIRKFGLKNQGVPLFFLVLGMFLFCVAEILWLYFNYLKNIEPYPSMADVFFLAVYPITLVGLISKIRKDQISLSYKLIQQFCPFVILLLILTALVYNFGIIGAYVPEDSYASNLVSMLYGVGDLFLVVACFFVLVVTIEYKKGKMFWPWLFITLSYSVLLIGDVLFSANREAYSTGSSITPLIDIIWIMGYFIFGLGMVKFLEIIEGQESDILNKLKMEKGAR